MKRELLDPRSWFVAERSRRSALRDSVPCRHAPALSSCVLLLAASCSGGGDRPEPPTDYQIADSAGIELVRNLGSAVDTTGAELSLELRIGGSDGPAEHLFHRISDVRTDTAGKIYVADGTRSVRAYDARGTFLRRFGGPGSGPGEFTQVGDLFVWRDTIHVADVRQFRGYLFDTAGTVIGAYRGLLPDGSRLTPFAGGPGGWIVEDNAFRSRRTSYRVGVETRSTHRIVILDPSKLQEATGSRAAADSLLQPVTSYAGRRWIGIRSEEGPFITAAPPLFEPVPSRTSDARGFVYVAYGLPYVIDAFDGHRGLVRRITRAHDPVPVDDALVDELLARARACEPEDSYWRAAADLPRTGYLPAIDAIRASPEGWLWVRRADVDPEPAAAPCPAARAEPPPPYWDVFDPAGRFQSTIRLPPRFSLHQPLAGAVLGVLRDELGVEYVVEYGVRFQ
jgi:6-bladed beta-propeller